MGHTAGRQAQRRGAPGSSKARTQRAIERFSGGAREQKGLFESLFGAPLGRFDFKSPGIAPPGPQTGIVSEVERELAGIFRGTKPPLRSARRKERPAATIAGAAPTLIPTVPTTVAQAKKKRKRIGVGQTLITTALGQTIDPNIQVKELLGA